MDDIAWCVSWMQSPGNSGSSTTHSTTQSEHDRELRVQQRHDRGLVDGASSVLARSPTLPLDYHVRNELLWRLGWLFEAEGPASLDAPSRVHPPTALLITPLI